MTTKKDAQVVALNARSVAAAIEVAERQGQTYPLGSLAAELYEQSARQAAGAHAEFLSRMETMAADAEQLATLETILPGYRQIIARAGREMRAAIAATNMMRDALAAQKKAARP